MKTISLALTVLILAVLPISTRADSSKHTARYFKGLASEFVDKKVSIDVSFINNLERFPHDRYGALIATTFDSKSRIDGGKILVIADRSELISMVKKYGSSPDVERGRKAFDIDTKKLYGIFRQSDNKKVAFIDVTEEGVSDKVLAELKTDLANEKKAAVSKKPGQAVKKKPVPPAKKKPAAVKGKKALK